MTVSFHNVRLPEDVEQGAKGGPEFKTRILELDSANESRNQQWSKQRGSWDISYGISSKSQLDAVIAFFYARRGRMFGFRFKDWGDFEILNEQYIGTGDGTNRIFQVFKNYTDGTYSFNRVITRIVTGTLKVWVDGVLKTETTDYVVDYDTGIITFVLTHQPANTKLVNIECQFDVPVRFDVDKLDVTSQTYDAIIIGSMTLVELKSG